ncbi:NAD(P)/FAD-dependent oxidoreductase [Pseudoroseicyclus sp. H15]
MPAGPTAATHAVVACGAYSTQLSARLGDRIPLDTERGYHVMIKAPETVPALPITDASSKYVATPMQHGLRLAGTVEFAGLNAPPDFSRARLLLRQARELLPGLSGPYADSDLSLWMGRRPSMPDSLPVIGTSRRSPDVIYAFGHGHIGMASGSRTGMMVRDLVRGGWRQNSQNPFSPQRFR